MALQAAVTNCTAAGAHWSVTVQQTTHTGLLLLLKSHMKGLMLWRGRGQPPGSPKPCSWPQLVPGLGPPSSNQFICPMQTKKASYTFFCGKGSKHLEHTVHTSIIFKHLNYKLCSHTTTGSKRQKNPFPRRLNRVFHLQFSLRRLEIVTGRIAGLSRGRRMEDVFVSNASKSLLRVMGKLVTRFSHEYVVTKL